MQEFPSRLRRAIASAKVKKKALAGALGVTPQAVSNWLAGSAVPRSEHLEPMSAFLHCTVDSLVGKKKRAA